MNLPFVCRIIIYTKKNKETVMAKSELKAEKRDFSNNPRELRRKGKLPATLYGKGIDSISLQMDAKSFINAYKQDKYAIFVINLGNETHDTIVKNLQTTSTDDNILNIEFLRVSADTQVRITVPVETRGESPAVKAGGELVTNLLEMEVECLPSDMPHVIEVDISVMQKYDDSITVQDVKYPKGVRPIANPDTVVARVAAPKGGKGAKTE